MGKIVQKQLMENHIRKHMNFLLKRGFSIVNNSKNTQHKGEHLVLLNIEHNREIEFFWGVRNNNIFDSYWSISICIPDKSNIFFLDHYYSIKYRSHLSTNLNDYKGDTIEEKLDSFLKFISNILRDDLYALLRGDEWYDIPFLGLEPIDISMYDIKTGYTGTNILSLTRYKTRSIYNSILRSEILSRCLSKFYSPFKIQVLHRYKSLNDKSLPYYCDKNTDIIKINCYSCNHKIELDITNKDAIKFDVVCKKELHNNDINNYFIHKIGRLLSLPFGFNKTYHFYRSNKLGHPCIYFFKCPNCGQQHLLCLYSLDFNLKDILFNFEYQITSVIAVKCKAVFILNEIGKNIYHRFLH